MNNCVHQWIYIGSKRQDVWRCIFCDEYKINDATQKREWVGLTDEEMRDLEKQFNAERVRTSDEEYLVIYPSDYWDWQNAIAAKLKERNNG